MFDWKIKSRAVRKPLPSPQERCLAPRNRYAATLRPETVTILQRVLTTLRQWSTTGQRLLFILSMSFLIFAINGIVHIQPIHSSLDDREDIFVTHLIVIIKSEVSTFPMVIVICSRCCVCVWGSCGICHLLYIDPGKVGVLFPLLCSLWCRICKSLGTLPVGHIPSFAHYAISLPSLCRFTWKHWTYKSYILSTACLRLSQLSFICSIWGIAFSAYLFPFWWLR